MSISFYSIQTSGEGIARTTTIKLMRRAKRDALNLIETFVSKSNNPRVWTDACAAVLTASSVVFVICLACAVHHVLVASIFVLCWLLVYPGQFISENFLPHLLEPVLGDYARNVPAARNAEVLSVTIALVVRLKGDFAPHVPQIMESVVRYTLEMISLNTHDFPEHRVLLFKLLQELVSVLSTMDPPTIKVIVDAVIFGFKHQQRDVAEPVWASAAVVLVVRHQMYNQFVVRCVHPRF